MREFIGSLAILSLVLAPESALCGDNSGGSSHSEPPLLTFVASAPTDGSKAKKSPPPAYTAGSWTHTGGPIGGLGYDIRMRPDDPDIMYVTDAFAGVFKSSNGGKNWFAANNGITTKFGASGDAISIFSLTIDPNNHDILWTGTQTLSGVYRSADSGASWTNMNTGANGILEHDLATRGFAVQPGDSDTVYFAAEVPSWEWNGASLFDYAGGGVDVTRGVIYKTTDGGKTWTRIWAGENLARYIWIDPANPARLYASTGIFDREAANSTNTFTTPGNDPVPGGVGLLRSDDGGNTWLILNEAYGLDANELYFGSLFLHPTNPNWLLAAAGNDPFTLLTNAPEPMGGVYLSENGGDTWIEVLDGFNFTAVEICVGDPNVAYAGAKTGVFRSTDSGVSWEQVAARNWGSADVVGGFPIDMQCDSRDPNRLFINNYGGGNFLSTDGGKTWEVASKGYTGAFIASLAVASDNPSLIYAAGRVGLFKSTDGGQNWTGLAFGVAREPEALVVAVNPFDSTHVLAVVRDAGPSPLISHDGGATWAASSTGLTSETNNIVFSPHTKGLVFGSAEDQGIFYSINGGATWTRSNLTSGRVSAIRVHPKHGAVLYASLYTGALYKSVDSGRTWGLVNSNIIPPAGQGDVPSLQTIAIDVANSSKLYAGISNGILISKDGGVTWIRATFGLPDGLAAWSIVADQRNPKVLYASSENNGVFVSKDGGSVWEQVNTGLTYRYGRPLTLSPDGSVLYLGTWGNGVWRLGTPTRP